MSYQGNQLEDATSLQIVTAYASAKIPVPSQSASPGWYVVGGFWIDEDIDAARLQVLCMVNHASLTLNARLFNVTDAEVVSGSEASTTSLVLTRLLSAVFTIQGQKFYQVQVEAIGANQYDRYGEVTESSLTD